LQAGEDLTSGADGEDVGVPAGHAYAGSIGATGGAGAELTPSTGMSPNLPSSQLLGSIYLPHVSPGGGGGGFSLTGGVPNTPTGGVGTLIIGTFSNTPARPGGASFSLLPYPPASPPPNYTSLNHFIVGGSGGGGGGSHGIGLIGIASAVERWMAGSGGTGGGGAMAIRCGNTFTLSSSGVL
jgi:hypothetical protein